MPTGRSGAVVSDKLANGLPCFVDHFSELFEMPFRGTWVVSKGFSTLLDGLDRCPCWR